MHADDIYHKTAKGQAEMESRSHGLTARQRRLLILVNGSNDVAELQRLVQFDDAIDILGFLLADGFIESTSEPASEFESESEDTTSTTVPARDYALN